ncbi:CAAX prenyl protease 2 [Trichuris trichiura]|uniref:CAAX prenyl protease 2 n=1 Tax=Trichuris trichiura TaxID=36087 RepID=A0A077YZ70_TRITR|nr:CAAX prenyl protease 2 [Trichuris trichiura]
MRVMVFCMSWMKACLISPLFFAIAHSHHALEKKREGYSWQDILCTVGMVRHFMSVFLCHVFCNFMGFPDVSLLDLVDSKKRRFVLLCFFAGAILWISFLLPFTDPRLYDNSL